MKKNNLILSAALAAVFSTSAVFAEAEVTGKFTYERAQYSKSGSTIGNFGNSTVNNTAVFDAATDPAAAAGALPGVNVPTDAYYGMTTTGATPLNNSEVFKSEAKAQIFIDGEVNSDATYHVELQGFSDNKATNNHDSNESYTQRDPLREAYVDTMLEDWSIRAGKQQVVWGTADGMKLLDTINPTDYSEMAQNQMEDSRITTWMLNAEKDLEDGSSVQIVISQPKENVFAGLNRNVSTAVRTNGVDAVATTDTVIDSTMNNGTDTGHAFMMMGPDTITGASNGFLNIIPDLGSVASRFAMAFTADGSAADDTVSGNAVAAVAAGASTTGTGSLFNAFKVTKSNLTNPGMEGFIVGTKTSAAGTTFASMTMAQMNVKLGGQALTGAWSTANGNNFRDANTSGADGSGISEGFERAIYSVAQGMHGATPTAAQINAVTGAQMLDAGFAPLYDSNLSTFADGNADSAFEYMGNTTFRTFDTFADASSQYVYNMPSDSDVDVAARFKGSKDGINYSVNTSYNYDKNPIIDLSWRGTAGQKLSIHTVKSSYDGVGAATADYDAAGAGGVTTTLQLYDAAAVDAPTTDSGNHDVDFMTGTGVYGSGVRSATMRFSQEVKRVKQFGGSFDTAVETAALGPVVIRGEALYTKDGYSPVMSKTKLAIGDLVGALQMVKADRFKYVLGADVTALTNMMISAQFIQDRNLDFVDDASGYTADYSTMHLSNGFKKAEKNKNFYSLFFSKPFGASGEHRWNNITMLEKSTGGNGKWNRLDAEFSIDDDTQATVEYNKYWGGANSQFGQLEKTSNIQVGVKYSF